MAIYLVQHGRSLSKAEDPQKGLSAIGRDEVRRIAQVAADYGIHIHEILHSGKQRAAQTAEIMAEKLKPEKGVRSVNGINPMDDVVKYAQTLDSGANDMIVGHLPFLEKLTAWLVTGQDGSPVFQLQNGGILCLDRYRDTQQIAVKWALMPNIQSSATQTHQTREFANMNKPSWHPDDLLQLSGSYWEAFTLHTGVKLDLFTLLADDAMPAAMVAEKTGADQRGMAMLLNALSAMGLIDKTDQLYRAAMPAKRYLNRHSDEYIGYIILHHSHLADSWARLEDAVKTGKPLRSRASYDEGQRREAFLMGMYNLASRQAPRIAAEIDLGGRKKLLDLGGGPGTYAIHFCKQNPHLEATIYDLPTTRPFAERTVALHGLSKRIAFTPGDYLAAPIEGAYDVAWLSHILHAEGPQACERIVAKVAQSLAPGGVVLIHEFILQDTMDGPLIPALFALNMLQGTEAGQSYSESQIRQMLQKAGITNIQRLGYVGPTESGILKGTRAGLSA